MITEKQGFEAMLHMLKVYREFKESNDIVDILSGGQCMKDGEPVDPDILFMWEDAVEKVKNGEPPIELNLTK
jgi:hypothetical protein